MTARSWLEVKMWPDLAAEAEVYVHDGSVYAPLLFDPEIEAELQALAGKVAPPGGEAGLSPPVLLTERGYFIKTLSLASWVEHYQVVFPEAGERQRAALRQEIMPAGPVWPAALDAKFKTIIFEVLPHFVRLPQGRRLKRDKGAILGHLAAKVHRQGGSQPRLEDLQEQRHTLQQILDRLADRQTRLGPPPGGWQSGENLARWLSQACLARLAAREEDVWRRHLAEIQELLELPEPHLAVLLALADRGHWEIDGCGCQREPKHPKDFIVYVRTGEYLLKDYFGRLYLFPDCRVGVSTAGPFYPMVLDRYKHPLLRRHDARQRICLQDYAPSQEFSGAGIIRALEEGLKALFYGYNSRKRNGYNSLDAFGRHQSVVAFDDWRLTPDEARSLSGTLEVKNEVL